ncbi:MAG: anthranilate synthase component I [Nitrospira sp.]|nr:anthranilate synthase component I [Nitrospira sp.]
MNYIFKTPRGIQVERHQRAIDFRQGIAFIIDELDHRRGMILSSGVEEPNRYTRWDIGFIDPPIEAVACDRRLRLEALNRRGQELLSILKTLVFSRGDSDLIEESPFHLLLEVKKGETGFAEEERSRQPTVFSPLRHIIEEFAGLEDRFLGFYGAFGYDLIFQFDPIEYHQDRSSKSKDLHLYLPDQIYVVDRRKEIAIQYDYLFSTDQITVKHEDRSPFRPLSRRLASGHSSSPQPLLSDFTDEEFAAVVEETRKYMLVGDIFEIVLHRKFSVDFGGSPSMLYRRLHELNPSPYEFVCQFGDEQLVGTSPEMFVRTERDRVESCPISGTVRRGANPMEDADKIKALYNSEKDEVELTMCTDVDRNDKSRICLPGTVRLLSRRLIERYAGLFHTVDHVEGKLREGLSGIDALLSHMWAVTLTGAPKRRAVQLIEKLEREARGWYGGAVGALLFNGDVNTGITIRTVHLEGKLAHYRVGATLVYDSKGQEEEAETRTKSTAFFNVLTQLGSLEMSVSAAKVGHPSMATSKQGAGLRIILIDYEDSFVHTLADYFRQTGAHVTTYRHTKALEDLIHLAPNLIVHSPGPGRPVDFSVPHAIRYFAGHHIPQFGICLGLQGTVEAFGGELSVFAEPRHGKAWQVWHSGSDMFDGVPSPCRVGAYHSLYAIREKLPGCLEVLAENEGGVVMAVRHRELPIKAVQFHPESILSMEGSVGHRIVTNVVSTLQKQVSKGSEMVNDHW